MDDIDFGDCDDPHTMDPVAYIPAELREAARRLPSSKAHTVLSLPPPGSGHNAGLLAVAGICWRMGVSFDDTLDHLQSIYNIDRLDYETAPRRAVARVWEADGDIKKLAHSDSDSAGVPDAREEMLLRFRRTPHSAIVEESPGDLSTPTLSIIANMYPAGAIVNIQATALEFGTLCDISKIPAFLHAKRATIDDFKFLNPARFRKIEGVPNPLQGDKVSTRCNANVAGRDWMVLEMDTEDEGKRERFNTFAMTLAKFAPLYMAVDTGNKSVHFWFDGRGAPKKTRAAFFALACLHGADKRLAVKSQIARMPNVSSAQPGRGPQKLIYFDPEGTNHPAKAWDLPGFENFLRLHQQLDYYYVPVKNRYMRRDNLDSWISLDRTSVRSHLTAAGYRAEKTEGELCSPLDDVINSVQLNKNVEAVVPGASGRHAGIYEENGNRVIVTKSPTFLRERRGEWPSIAKFLDGLLGHDSEQLPIFFGWLQDCILNLRNGGKRQALWAPSQMIHIIGPANAGKTLLLKDLLVPAFGGRSACADPVFRRIPDMHNPDTFAAELLYLDDSPVLESNHAFRQEFGERIKSFVVGTAGGLRDMHQGRVNIRPWWRFVRLMNQEPTTLATLPLMDDGVADKLIIFQGASMTEGPLAKSMKLPGWYDRLKLAFCSELPSFLHYLMHEYRVSDSDKDPEGRYAVRSFKSSEVLAAMDEGSPEATIVYMLTHTARAELYHADLFDPDRVTPFRGTADQLYVLLAESGSHMSNMRFQKMCPTPRILSSQLRAIERLHPERVCYSTRLPKGHRGKILNGCRYWYIAPPGEFISGSGEGIEELL